MAPGMEADDARELLRRCRQDEEEAWHTLRQLFERVARRVLANKFSTFTLTEREDAEGRALVRVIAAIQHDRVRAASRFQLIEFMRIVVTNCARDVWRKRQPTEPLPTDTVAGGPDPGDEAQLQRRLDCVIETIRTWPFVDRFVFEMKLANASAATISAEAKGFGLSLSSGAVHLKWFRLVRKLRRRCE